ACSSAPTSRATRCSRSSRASPTSCGTDAAGCRPSASTGATARSRPSPPTSSRAEVRVAVRAEPAPAVHARGAITSWLSTVDHKRIGILYILTAVIFFVAGGILALLMRAQLATPNEHFLTRSSYNEVMTMHGTTMVFLVVVPILAGFGNYLVPLMIGARDMAFPRLNAMSYWLYVFGGIVLFASFFAHGGPSQAGWTAYVPLSSSFFSPGHGVDYWILGLHLLTLSSLAGAINFLVTIHNMRTPGMSWM